MADKKKNANKAKTKSETFALLAERTGMSRKDVGAFFDTLADVIHGELGKKGPGVFTLPGLLKMRRITKPAIKGGERRPNPFKPGEFIITKPKAARNVVKAQALKSLKEAIG
jgi:hypothetical protein